MLLILSVKKERKELHLLAVREADVLSAGLRSLFTVEKRAFGLEEPE